MDFSLGYEYTDDDVSDAAPTSDGYKAEDDETDSNDDAADTANLQFMVTNRMRRVLEDELNYHEEEVELMDPQIASVVIERGLARPLTGMPKSWQRIKPSTPMLSGLSSKIASFADKVGKSVVFACKRVLPVAIPIFAAVYSFPKLIALVQKLRTSVVSTKRTKSTPSIQRASEPLPQKQSNVVKEKQSSGESTIPKVDSRIDMKALNKIVRPSTLVEKLFGR